LRRKPGAARDSRCRAPSRLRAAGAGSWMLPAGSRDSGGALKIVGRSGIELLISTLDTCPVAAHLRRRASYVGHVLCGPIRCRFVGEAFECLCFLTKPLRRCAGRRRGVCLAEQTAAIATCAPPLGGTWRN